MRKLIFSVLICATAVYAQEKDAPQEEVKARDLAKNFVEEQGWELGKNEKGDAYVAIGAAGFSTKSENYSLSRSNAFQLAALSAKNELARFLSAEIESRVRANIESGGGGKKVKSETSEKSESPVDPEDVDKLTDAVRKEAEAKGISPNQVMESTQFKSATRTVARAEVVGASTSRVFQSTVGGKSGIACVVRFTAVSRQLAECAMGKADAPELETLPEVGSWTKEQKKDELINYFGVRILKLKSNQACIAAFGQAVARSDSDSSMAIAKEKAEAAADQELRMFVGEMVESDRVMERGSSVKEMSESGEEFEDQESFRLKITAESKSLKMPGIATKRTWDAVEQATGAKKTVVGVVRVWSAESADAANALRKQMEAVGGSQGGSGRMNIAPKSGAVDAGPKTAKPLNTTKKIEEP